jgi:hypothetical protein
MKLKKLLTESSILMAIAIISTVGIASAAVVNYLTTGSVTTTTQVSSPIEMSINEGRDGGVSGNHSIAMATTGGSDFGFTTVAKNNANNDIEGYRPIVLDAPDGMNFVGGEVTDMIMDTVSGQSYVFGKFYVVRGNGDLVRLRDWTGNSNKLVVVTSLNGTTADKDMLTAGSVDWNAFTMTTNPAIEPGTYTISSDFVVDLATYTAEQY